MKYVLFCLLFAGVCVLSAEPYSVLNLQLTEQEELAVQTHTDFAMYRHFLELGKMEQAGKYLLRALEKHPASVKLLEAFLFLSLEYPAIAEQAAGIAEQHPEATLLNAAIADFLAQGKQKEKAEALLEKSLEYCFDHADEFQTPQQYRNVAFLITESLQTAKTEKDFDRVRRLRKRAEAEFPLEQDLTYLHSLLRYFREKEKSKTDFQKTIQKIQALPNKPGLRLSGNQADLLRELVKAGALQTAEDIVSEQLLSSPEESNSYAALKYLLTLKGDFLNAARAGMFHLLLNGNAMPGDKAEIAFSLLDAGEVSGALVLFDSLISDGVKECLPVAAHAALRMKELDKAENYAKQITDPVEQLSVLASIRAQQKQFSKAVAYLLEREQLLLRAGKTLSVPEMIELAALAEKAGMQTVQKRVEDNLRKNHLLEPDVRNYFGYCWAERNENLIQAEEYIRQALSADPGNVAYLDSLAWLQYRQGKWNEAWDTIQNGIRLWPENTPLDGEIASHAGDIAAARKDWANAREYWQTALRQDSYNIEKESLIRKLSEIPGPIPDK